MDQASGEKTSNLQKGPKIRLPFKIPTPVSVGLGGDGHVLALGAGSSPGGIPTFVFIAMLIWGVVQIGKTGPWWRRSWELLLISFVVGPILLYLLLKMRSRRRLVTKTSQVRRPLISPDSDVLSSGLADALVKCDGELLFVSFIFGMPFGDFLTLKQW
jgi:hypothetical protein